MAMGIALLALTGVAGVTDSEQVMPLVLLEFLPAGLRGLVIAGLLAAFMSTFSSTINCGASFIVRDLWQAYFKPQATERQAVRFSYGATLFLVLVGIIIGFNANSIAQIWNWMMMALSAGVVVPNVLRWYWWRMNGIGYALGTFAGIGLALLALFRPGTPIYIVFPLICLASLLACILASVATRPVDRETLVRFYRCVRPFGSWRPIRMQASLTAEEEQDKTECLWLTLVNVLLGMLAILGLYLFPMYLVGHWYAQSLACFVLSAAAMIALYFTWYRNLPAADVA